MWQDDYLQLMANGVRDNVARRRLGISKKALETERTINPAFAEAEQDYRESVVDTILDTVLERGIKGYDKPVIYQGVITDTYKEYSDTLLIKAGEVFAPELFANKNRTTFDGNVTVKFLTDDQLIRESMLAAGMPVIDVPPVETGTTDNHTVLDASQLQEALPAPQLATEVEQEAFKRVQADYAAHKEKLAAHARFLSEPEQAIVRQPGRLPPAPLPPFHVGDTPPGVSFATVAELQGKVAPDPPAWPLAPPTATPSDVKQRKMPTATDATRAVPRAVRPPQGVIPLEDL